MNKIIFAIILFLSSPLAVFAGPTDNNGYNYGMMGNFSSMMGFGGGWVWIWMSLWFIIAILLIVLLVAVIIKLLKK